jgi:hypothetical protein
VTWSEPSERVSVAQVPVALIEPAIVAPLETVSGFQLARHWLVVQVLVLGESAVRMYSVSPLAPVR